MANGNTKWARHQGHSGLKHLRSGQPKDWGQAGPEVDTSTERAKTGKKPWVGASPPKRAPKPRHNRGGGKEVKSNG